MKCKIVSYLTSLFESNKRKKRVFIDVKCMKKIEEDILDKFDRTTICNYYEISKSTYYKIKRGEHKLSSQLYRDTL